MSKDITQLEESLDQITRDTLRSEAVHTDKYRQLEV
jgi:hypothetical protein